MRSIKRSSSIKKKDPSTAENKEITSRKCHYIKTQNALPDQPNPWKKGQKVYVQQFHSQLHKEENPHNRGKIL